MCFTVCGAKEERIQCRTEDPETRGGEDHGYLQRGSGGGEVGGWGGGGVSLPQRDSPAWRTGSRPRL